MPRESRIVYAEKPKPPRPFPRRPVFWSAGIGLAVALAAAVLWTANLPAFAVTVIDVSGPGASAGEIRQAVEAILEGNMLFVVPRRNFFAVSSARIEDELRRQFPALASVSVDKEFPHRIIIRAEGRNLWGVYCRRERTEPPSGCAYLDTGGTAFEELEHFSGWLLSVIYGSLPVRPGEVAVMPRTLEFFGEAETGLDAIGADLLSLSLSTSTPDDARLDLAEGWYLLVTPSRPVAEWMGALGAVLEREIGERRAGLEYVDLRFGAKVFYRFK